MYEVGPQSLREKLIEDVVEVIDGGGKSSSKDKAAQPAPDTGEPPSLLPIEQTKPLVTADLLGFSAPPSRNNIPSSSMEMDPSLHQQLIQMLKRKVPRTELIN